MCGLLSFTCGTLQLATQREVGLAVYELIARAADRQNEIQVVERGGEARIDAGARAHSGPPVVQPLDLFDRVAVEVVGKAEMDEQTLEGVEPPAERGWVQEGHLAPRSIDVLIAEREGLLIE